MSKELTIAFIGGGNMASAVASGLIGKRCGAHDVHVVDPNEQVLTQWSERGCSTATSPDERLRDFNVWILAVKPQFLKQAVADCRAHLAPGTLIISVAAGISAGTLADWLGGDGDPYTRVVRGMPNTPALIGAGVTGMMAMPGASDDDKALAQQLMRTVGQVVWVDTDAQIDAVTALSGSGPAYVFLFLEALIEGGLQQGLTQDQSRTLALATVSGATELAGLSAESLQTLRERVTSKGGTTAAALAVFQQQQFKPIVLEAMQAAGDRAAQLSNEFAK